MRYTLHKYLALHNTLSIPGIGHFVIKHEPAAILFTEKKVMPPSNHISFVPVVHPTNNHFYSFLSREWSVEKVIAIRMYKEQVEALLEQLQKLGMCELPGIGILRKTEEGSIGFSESKFRYHVFSSLPAERVMRRDAIHSVLVGEQQHLKAHTQDEEIDIAEPATVKDKWWVYSLVLAVVALLFIVYYYTVLRR